MCKRVRDMQYMGESNILKRGVRQPFMTDRILQKFLRTAKNQANVGL